jgi:ATP-dependent exoDNAse (exonuclease V) beta subunit
VDQGRIELADGRTLPANYRTFDHGYAVTAHRSQGQTVDAVIVSGDRMSKELFYVAATRGRESLTVITSDKEQLREAIGISGERTSATELARKAEQQTQLGPLLPELRLGHSLETAADFVLWRSTSLAAEEQQKPAQVIQPEIAPALQRQQKQEMEIDHGFGIGF